MKKTLGDRISKTLLFIFALAFVLTISGCGFKPRTSADVPPPLRTLYLKTPNPYSQFSTSLRTLLRSLDIHLVKNPKDAEYGLRVSKTLFTHSNPGITASNTAVSFSYDYTVSVRLTNQAGLPIVSPRSFSASRSLLLNLNQIYTPGGAILVKPELERDVISQIFSWLTSRQIRAALVARLYQKKKGYHATRAIRHAS